jgi:hypothetical protein
MAFPFTPREIAKYGINALIYSKASDVASDVMVDYTSLEEDSKTVRISSSLIGMYIAAKLDPVTDKIVDKTADFIVAANNKRKDKNKNDTEEK